MLSASQAANGNFAAATATTSFTVAPEVPTLTFATIPAQTFGNVPFAVSATSASSGAVTYTVVSGPATISGNMVTLTGTGTVMLHASQAANGNFAAATATTSFTVNPPPNVTITPITPANQTTAPVLEQFVAIASGGVTNNLTWSATGGTFSGNVWTPPDIAGTYTITATSAENPAVSVSTTATISAPVITVQPVSKNVCSGTPQTLSVAANYASSYQWLFNGNQIGTTTPTLTLTNPTSANSGNYSCVVSNGAGSVTSNVVNLNVVTPTTLTITSNPASVSVYATQTATFSVSATGTGILSYQWYTGTPGSGTAINGATSSTYTTGALTVANDGTTYYATVTDSNCTGTTLTSTAATLAVSDTDTAVPPTIVVQPIGETATVGGTATFSVTRLGIGNAQLSVVSGCLLQHGAFQPHCRSAHLRCHRQHLHGARERDRAEQRWRQLLCRRHQCVWAGRLQPRCPGGRSGDRAPDRFAAADHLCGGRHAGQFRRERHLHRMHPCLSVVLVHSGIDRRCCAD